MFGIIYLLDFDGTVLKFYNYRSVKERNQMIEVWKKMVGKKFGQMYLQVAPLSRVKPKK
jgi:hypothetical protein